MVKKAQKNSQDFQEGKRKSLQDAINDINKRHGEGTIMTFATAPTSVNFIPSGSIALDAALGIGGFPRGRIVEVYGNEGSGKTTICLHTIAQAQRIGGTCAFIDMEHALDPVYAQKLGVNIDDLYITQPDTAESALNIAETLISSGSVDIVVVDSVAALVPSAELAGDFGDSHVGLQARLMSQALRKLTGIVKKTDTVLIFTNQQREKIGIMYGDPTVTTGGKALKFYASVRLQVAVTQQIKSGTDVIGKNVKITVKKNKLAPPFRIVEVRMMHDVTNDVWGIDNMFDIANTLLRIGAVNKSGMWYKLSRDFYGADEQYQGINKFTDALRSDSDLYGKSLEIIQNSYKLATNAVMDNNVIENDEDIPEDDFHDFDD